MNILFLTIGRFESIEAHSIYPDLLREFRNNGHKVYVVCAQEKRFQLPTICEEDQGVVVLRVCIGNITKCGMLEKGISTLTINNRYKKAIEKYFYNIKFDMVLYSTPPITLCEVVEFIKERDNSKTYLLLKDIFPQNAVDLGLIRLYGVKGLIYKYFRYKEKKLYRISDCIGCMSQANVDYVIKNNPEINKNKVVVCPNAIEPVNISLTQDEIKTMRGKYNIPIDKQVFVYGGNLGKPQGIPFFIKCLRTQRYNKKVHFLIVGDGTEYDLIENFLKTEKQENVCLLPRISKNEYDRMIAACDVGMIFLDHRFTIPNFPSRLLAYMQVGIPVLACTDENTDLGKIIVEGNIGWWSESNNVEEFEKMMTYINDADLSKMKPHIWEYLVNNYHVKDVYKNILKQFKF